METTPIISGFHPDPSICTDGQSFYLINSSFEYHPGIPIFRSENLIDWLQIGNVLDRPECLELGNASGGGGVFAPTIRYSQGRFWVIATNISDVRRGHFIVSSENPSGPWSDPVYVSGAVGFDPDLFWDTDGTCYLTWSVGGGESPIRQATVDPTMGTLLSDPRPISSDHKYAHPEGPHLFRRGSFYYLVLAEGGTEHGHCVTVGRATSPSGPFEWAPSNPILTRRSTSHVVQNTGHGDFVERDGVWSMVHLGVRKVGPTPHFHLNGRETFLAGIEWNDDWPAVVEERYTPVAKPTRFTDDFSNSPLDHGWIMPGTQPKGVIRYRPSGGVTIPAPQGDQLRYLLARRVSDMSWRAEASFAEPSGRITVRVDDLHWACVEVVGSIVRASLVVGGHVQHLAEVSVPGWSRGDALFMKSVVEEVNPYLAPKVADHLSFGVVVGGQEEVLATCDGRYLSTEVAGGFTGRVVGVEAVPNCGDCHVSEFTYAGG